MSSGCSYVARVAVRKGRAPSGTGTTSWGLLAAAGAAARQARQGRRVTPGRRVPPAVPSLGPDGPRGAVWSYTSTVAGTTSRRCSSRRPGKLLLRHGRQLHRFFAAEGRRRGPACTGTWTAPTAPRGKVCLYLFGSTLGLSQAEGYAFDAPVSSFIVAWQDSHAGGNEVYIEADVGVHGALTGRGDRRPGAPTSPGAPLGQVRPLGAERGVVAVARVHPGLVGQDIEQPGRHPVQEGGEPAASPQVLPTPPGKGNAAGMSTQRTTPAVRRAPFVRDPD